MGKRDRRSAPVNEQRIVKGVSLSVGAKLQPKDRSPPHTGETVASLALPLYHTPPRFYKAKRKRRETLRRRKICPSCGRANSADRTDCADCGARLPEMTLYDLYRSRHRCCPGCGVAVTNVARYCPECGARLPKGAARREAAV